MLFRSLGAAHSCARLETGAAVCWGDNTEGALGDGTTERRERAVAVTGLLDATALAAGQGFTCALHRNGSASCWGDNRDGSLGDGSTTSRPRPAAVAGLAGVARLVAGPRSVCALAAGGRVLCWGGNRKGPLAEGREPQPRPVPFPGFDGEAVSVAVGRDHVCVLDGEGSVLCRGANDDAQLGMSAGAGRPDDGGRDNRLRIEGAVELVAGESFTCARLASGAVQCWGDNDQGQIGGGEDLRGRYQARPSAVEGLGDAERLIAGLGASICAEHHGGGFVCWGDNDHGQVGSSAEVHSAPAPLRGPDRPRALDLGLDHGCALDSGEVRCFGDNRARQLGAPGLGGHDAVLTVPGLRAAR